MTKHKHIRRRRAYRYFRYLCALQDSNGWLDLSRTRIEGDCLVVPWSVIYYLPRVGIKVR